MSVPVPGQPGDPGWLPAPVSLAAPGAGPGALAGELLARARAGLPAVGGLGSGEQVLVSARLIGLRSARTRRACDGDVVAWLGWPASRETSAPVAGPVCEDLWRPRGSMTGRRRSPCAADAGIVLPVLRRSVT